MIIGIFLVCIATFLCVIGYFPLLTGTGGDTQESVAAILLVAAGLLFFFLSGYFLN